jgi:hypothetical protein
MPLAQDQRAMLQLLLERDQSYEDIASLLGGSREDVRRRARAALEELGGQDPDREIGLTDYILGQADPIGRADAVRHLQSDPDSLALAEELSTKLRLIAPQAELPDLPQPKSRRRAAAAAATDGAPEAGEPTAAPERGSPLAGLSTRQSRLFAAIGASALILLFVILAIAGVFGGGDDESASSGEATTASDEAGSTVSDEVARIVMQPQGDSDASGEAVIGLANETQPFIDLDLENLPEISNDEAYIFWFLLSRDSGFPLPGALPVNSEGAIQDRLAIPSQTLGFVVQSRFLAVSIVDRRELASEIDRAIEERAGELPFSGEPVLLGEIPAAAEGEIPQAGAGGAGAGGAGALPEGVAPEGQAPAP